MSGLLELPFSTEGLPDWLSVALPQAWRAGVILAAIALAWFTSFLGKVAVRRIAKGASKNPEEFEGSLWDILAPIIQFATFAGLLTLLLEYLGVPLGARLAEAWPAAIAVIIIFIAAFFIARYLSRAVESFGERAQRRTRADKTLFSFTASIVSYAVFIIAGVLALDRLGFDTTTLVALVGAAGLAIGLALQDTLKAVASGLMLALFRPYRIGDWVEIAGKDGEVVSITPFQTSLKTVDNKIEVLPNTVAWSDPITNYSKQPRRRLDLYFDVSYEDDIDTVLKLLIDTANGHRRVLARDETWAGVHSFASSSVVYRLRAWVPGSEFIQVRADMYRLVKYAFDKAGITIPYPHQVEIFRDARSVEQKREAPSKEE